MKKSKNLPVWLRKINQSEDRLNAMICEQFDPFFKIKIGAFEENSIMCIIR
jgi:hypothetical protein